MPEINFRDKKETGFQHFFNQNKRLVILIGILIVLIILAVIINVKIYFPFKEKTNDENSIADKVNKNGLAAEENYVEILPKLERPQDYNDDLKTENIKIIEPFAKPKKLLGVVCGGSGQDIAIVGSENSTYLIEEGDILDNEWHVKEITENAVYLEAGEKESILKLSESFSNDKGEISDSENVTVDVRNVDIRDLLSALAIKTATNIFLMEEPDEVTFNLKNISPMKALQLVVQNEGWTYLQNGNLLLVGSSEKIQDNYYNYLVLTRFDLMYITAEMLEPLIEKLGLSTKVISLENNSKTLWLEGDPQALTKVKELIATVDRPENSAEMEFGIEFKKITTSYISPQKAVELLQQAGIPLDNFITFGKELLIFDEEALESWTEIAQLVLEIDNVNSREYIVFDYDLQNTTAKEAAERLEQIGFEGVKVITFNFPELTHEILIISPPHLKRQIIDSLYSIDKVQEKIKAPIAVVKGKDARNEIKAKRELLSEMTGIDEDRMYISDNLSGDSDNPHYVLWIKDTPDTIQKLQNLVKSFDG